MRSALLRGCLLVALSVFAVRAVAQDEEHSNSPRAALQSFLEAAHAGHYAKAAREAFPPSGTGPGFADPAATARELVAVIETYVEVNLAKLPDASDTSGSTTQDIGRVPSNSDHPDAIRLVKLANVGWVFSPVTLNRVPAWYADLPDHWIRELLPEPLLRAGPRDVLWWQWLALPPIILLSYALGRLMIVLLRLVVPFFARRLPRRLESVLLHRLVAPASFIVTTLMAGELVRFLFLTVPAHAFVHSLVSALVLAAVFWAGLRVVDVAIEALREAPFAAGRPERIALLPLFRKAAKITLGVVAAVEVLQRLGYPAASLIAGLGIGGLAVALAAQKTVENLLGSIVLTIDQPFRPGDTVKIDDLVGTVESIGLRSTRIRTDRRTVVTIPNGRLSDMRIETFAPRDRIVLNAKIGLVYTTGAAQIRKVVEDIRQYLTARPDVYPDSTTVFFTTISPGSADVEISTAINTTDFNSFQTARQECLIRIMELVAASGTALAVPVQASPPKS